MTTRAATPWHALAVDQGMALARKLFAKRGNHFEAHLNEAELAALLAIAYEAGANMADQRGGAHDDLVKALEEAFCDTGRAGANADTNHPLRGTWKRLRAALAKAGAA